MNRRKPDAERKDAFINFRLNADEARRLAELQRRIGARNRSQALRVLIATVEPKPRRAA